MMAVYHVMMFQRYIYIYSNLEPPVVEPALKATLAEPQSCKAGEDITLKLPFAGRPKPTAEWTKDGTPIEFKGSKSATKQIHTVDISQHCLISR